jgi:hypothetical protein
MKPLLLLLIFSSFLESQTEGTPHRFPQTLADWQTLLPSVEKALQVQFGEHEVEGPYGVGIYGVGEVTGDGTSQALVSFGVPGASTTPFTLVRMQAGKPVVAQFKDRRGKIGPMTFVEGASVMHSDTVRLLTKEHALCTLQVFFTSGGPDEGQKVQKCGGEAYQWNPATAVFQYSQSLTDRLTQDLCRKVREEWK